MEPTSGISLNLNQVICPLCRKESGDILSPVRVDAELRICSDCYIVALLRDNGLIRGGIQ